MIKGNTFVAWTGHLDKGQKKYNSPLIIYNISQLKREESLPNDIDNIYVNFVSDFPRENNKEYDGKHLLYSGDKNGVLRIYEIETENPKFQLKSKLQTNNNGEAILSAMGIL